MSKTIIDKEKTIAQKLSMEMSKRIGMTLSICNYKNIYICIVVARDFQVSDSGSREPLVLEPSGNPLLKKFWIRAWITVKNRSFLITCIISPVGVLVPFLKDDYFMFNDCNG
jgi:hypothetical protein